MGKMGFLRFFALDFQTALQNTTQNFNLKFDLAVYRFGRVKDRNGWCHFGKDEGPNDKHDLKYAESIEEVEDVELKI